MQQNIYKLIIGIYIVAVAALTFIPLGGMSTSLSGTTVLSLRLDYLLHALVFIPLVPLWKLARPRHSLWLIIPASLLAAALAEVSHYWIPYRGYNINDLLGNMLGVALSIPIYFLVIKKWLPAK